MRGVDRRKVSGLGADDNAFAHDYHATFLNSALDLNVALALFPFTAYGDAFQDGVLVTAEGRVTIKPFGLGGATISWTADGATRSVSRSSKNPSNLARLLATNQFPRLADPGPVLTRFLERFFPSLLVPTQPLNTDASIYPYMGSSQSAT